MSIFRQFFPKKENIVYNVSMEGIINNKKTIENVLEELSTTIYRLEESLKFAPAGNIAVKKAGSAVHFYVLKPDGSQEYLGAGKEEMIKALAQKKYDKWLLDAALKEKEIFVRALKGFQEPKKYRTMNQVNEAFPEVLKKYVTLEESTDEGFIRQWSKPIPPSIDENSEDYEKYHLYRTMKGEIVRSKSEIIIADHLNRAGIPYHYEKVLIIDDGCDFLKPDFTVLNTRTLKTYYWEHFGRMDDPEYSYKTKQKIETYANNDYFLGRDLIATFETSKSPVSIWYIDMLIEQFFK